VRLPRPTPLFVALAWAALLLPWERCTSDCHERFEALAGAHDCHDGEKGCDGEDSAEHERVEFVSLAPQGKVAVDVALLATAAGAEMAPIVAALERADASGPRAPPKRLKTVVLLL
jgi:hypothetical protein